MEELGGKTAKAPAPGARQRLGTKGTYTASISINVHRQHDLADALDAIVRRAGGELFYHGPCLHCRVHIEAGTGHMADLCVVCQAEIEALLDNPTMH